MSVNRNFLKVGTFRYGMGINDLSLALLPQLIRHHTE